MAERLKGLEAAFKVAVSCQEENCLKDLKEAVVTMSDILVNKGVATLPSFEHREFFKALS